MSKRPLDDLEEIGSSSKDASASAKKQATVKDSSAPKKVTPAAQRKERETKVKGANVGELKSFIMDTLLADSEIGSKVALKIDSWSTAAAFKPPADDQVLAYCFHCCDMFTIKCQGGHFMTFAELTSEIKNRDKSIDNLSELFAGSGVKICSSCRVEMVSSSESSEKEEILLIDKVKDFFGFTAKQAEAIPHKKRINTYEDRFGNKKRIKTEKFGRTSHLFKLDKVVAAVVQRDGSVYKFAEKIVLAALAREKELVSEKQLEEKRRSQKEVEEGSDIDKGEGDSNDL